MRGYMREKLKDKVELVRDLITTTKEKTVTEVAEDDQDSGREYPPANPIDHWKSLTTKLLADIETSTEELTQLKSDRGRLVLDASQSKNGAAAVIDKFDVKIARVTKDIRIKRDALVEVGQNLAKAEAEEVGRQEKSRTAAMESMAAAIIDHAKEFTSLLDDVNRTAIRLRVVVNNMNQRATPDERRNLNNLYEHGPWVRAIEFAGLRDILPMIPSYPGPKQHIIPLEDSLRIHLARWLPASEQPVQEPSTSI